MHDNPHNPVRLRNFVCIEVAEEERASGSAPSSYSRDFLKRFDFFDHVYSAEQTDLVLPCSKTYRLDEKFVDAAENQPLKVEARRTAASASQWLMPAGELVSESVSLSILANWRFSFSCCLRSTAPASRKPTGAPARLALGRPQSAMAGSQLTGERESLLARERAENRSAKPAAITAATQRSVHAGPGAEC